MLAHSRHRGAGLATTQFKLDIGIDLVEALLATELRAQRAEKPLDLLTPALCHHALPSAPSPRLASAALSFCRASCNVL